MWLVSVSLASGLLVLCFTGLSGVRFPPGWEGATGRGHLQKLRAFCLRAALEVWRTSTTCLMAGLTQSKAWSFMKFFIFGQCVCGSSWWRYRCSSGQRLQCSLLQKIWGRTGRTRTRTTTNVARSYRTFNYHARFLVLNGHSHRMSRRIPQDLPKDLMSWIQISRLKRSLGSSINRPWITKSIRRKSWSTTVNMWRKKTVRQTSQKLQQVPTKLSHTGMTLFQSLFTRDTWTKTIWSLSQRNQGGQPLYSIYSFVPNESSCKCKMSCRFELTIPSRRHLSCFWRVTFKSMVTADPRGLDTNSDSLCRIRKNKMWSR